MKSHIFSFFLAVWGILPTHAQFYSMKSDSSRIRPYALIKERRAVRKDSLDNANATSKVVAKQLKGKELGAVRTAKATQDSSAITRIQRPKILPFISYTMDKLQERLNLCLPLDELQVSSRFGARTDPFSKCIAFHDGVDLVCKQDYVYSMLPAIVTKVHHGSKGYGNYVILNHGRLECLYGHLDKITIKENEKISAGTIIGISGNTGKSTNYHLHIRLRNHGRSVDPLRFLGVLQAYIRQLNNDLSMVVPPQVPQRFGAILTQKNLLDEIIRQDVRFPRIVLAQAMLETGYFSSRVCREYNNLFGLRKRNGAYYQFDRWEDSVAAYRDYVQYKYTGGNYFDFLDRIGYAEDKRYTQKVRVIYQGIEL